VASHLARYLDPTRLDDLLLATSEVVSNAVLHAGAGSGQQVGLRLTRDAAMVRVAVTDTEPARSARIKPHDPTEPGGLGLRLVDRLSQRWGVEHRTAGTKEVWFEFLLSAPLPEPDGA
jgi:anti-sigma regulatory factor (Ser/Thr protein kinase)